MRRSLIIAGLCFLGWSNYVYAQTGGPGFIPGDANGDGRADGVDYVIWLNNYNTVGGSNLVGDFNSDGRIDGSDYVIWLNNYKA